MNNYLTIGTSNILDELFIPIKDSNKKDYLKPINGLWCSKHKEEYINCNEWLDFLLSRASIAYYKIKDFSNLPGAYITLKDDAKIFYLDSIEKLNFLNQNYPSSINLFSFEKLSKDYDGIFIDMTMTYSLDYNSQQTFKPFAVSSLLLFNVKPIKYYQPVSINIPEYNEQLGKYHEVFYTINIDKEKKYIIESNNEYKMLINEICINIKDYCDNNNISKSSMTPKEYYYLISLFIEKHYFKELQKYIMNTDKTTIEENIIQRYLSQ